MDDLQNKLEKLIEQWRKTSHPGLKAKLIQEILSTMQKSGKIWRAPGVSRELYSEALHDNWLWFTKNLNQYDPTRASVMVWFNRYLEWAISNLIRLEVKDREKRWNPPINDDGTPRSVENISQEQLAVDARHEPAGQGFHTSLNRLKRCVACHQPQLRQRSMQKRNDVSCDRIVAALLERVEQAPSSAALSDIFAQLAAEYQLDRQAFRRFCSTSCFRLLRQLCPRESS